MAHVFQSRLVRENSRVVQLALAITVCAVGCQQGQAPVTKTAQQSKLRSADRADALLKVAANQLNDLPSAVDTEMRPPVVLLDSRKSSDHQDVYAICKANPTAADRGANIIFVPTGNSRFRSLGVRAGDILRYFVLPDQTVDPDSQRSGMSRQKPLQLKVAKVIDDNTLLTDSLLNQEVDFPAKLEIWRNVDDRITDINDKLVTYHIHRLPPLGWEPAPDDNVMQQVLTWLNQWIQQSSIPPSWKREPMLDALPADLAAAESVKSAISAESLTAKSFLPHESRILQEAVWLRDISRWAHGDGFDNLGRATALFDWTVRNIQLESDEDGTPRRPWHTLLYGNGTAEQRAWVFAGLCRQQGLHVVMLCIPLSEAGAEAKSEKGDSPPPKMYWLAALFSNGQLYLFDSRLGLPIPGPDGKGVVTLEQVQKDDSLLRKLDLEKNKYPVTAELAKSAHVYIVADPFELTRRASQLEAGLAGEDRLVLSVNPSTMAEQLKSSPGVTSISLWEFPFSTLRDQLTLGKSARHREALAFEPFALRPALWKARTRHFQGRRKAATEPGGEALDDHQEAARLYLSKGVRPTGKEIAVSLTDKQRVDVGAKRNATYWLGLLSFDDGKHDVAANWFGNPDINAADSPWKAGAAYNLAHSFEAEHKIDRAIPLLEKSTSPQQDGDKIRARDLKSEADKAK